MSYLSFQTTYDPNGILVALHKILIKKSLFRTLAGRHWPIKPTTPNIQPQKTSLTFFEQDRCS